MALEVLILITTCALARGQVLVRGAGASFPNAVYQEWLREFEGVRGRLVDIHMEYDSQGSSVGKSRIMGEEGPPVEYAGSDSLLKEKDYEAHPDLQMLPSLAGLVPLNVFYKVQYVMILRTAQWLKQIIDQ